MKNSISGTTASKDPQRHAPTARDRAVLEEQDEPIICYWELGAEELPDFHRIVSASVGPAGGQHLARAGEVAAEHRPQTSSLAPTSTDTTAPDRARPRRSWFRRHPRWRPVTYAALVGGMTAAAVAVMARPTAEPLKSTGARAVLTFQALILLETRAAALDWVAGGEVDGMASPHDTPTAHPEPSRPRSTPAPSAMEKRDVAAASLATAPSAEPTAVGEFGADDASGHPTASGPRRPAQPRAGSAALALDDDMPADEVDVTWQEPRRAEQKSTDAQTPATPLVPNRSAGARHLDGTPRRR